MITAVHTDTDLEQHTDDIQISKNDIELELQVHNKAYINCGFLFLLLDAVKLGRINYTETNYE